MHIYCLFQNNLSLTLKSRGFHCPNTRRMQLGSFITKFWKKSQNHIQSGSNRHQKMWKERSFQCAFGGMFILCQNSLHSLENASMHQHMHTYVHVCMHTLVHNAHQYKRITPVCFTRHQKLHFVSAYTC
jgi:hypothetical protein